jgi:predicted GH43/DUF377 family glycosyl hydrolase
MSHPTAGIPFEVFAGFKRINDGDPILALDPPLWAAATHAIVVGDTVHYIWCAREHPVRWVINHATAPVDDLTDITQDPRNPIVAPSKKGFDDAGVEYPFPFLNPADGKYYMYYRGKGAGTPEQTGLLVSDGDLGRWTRVQRTPVIPAEHAYEADGSTHPSVVVMNDPGVPGSSTIQVTYTGKATKSYQDGLTMCHATAPVSDPAAVTKNPANPVFTGSGQAWDGRAVREIELFLGPQYIHVLYGGFDGQVWRIGHVRTRDFSTFEPSPYNPIFCPSKDPDAFDCDGVLTPQVIEVADTYYMVYAGKKGREWQTGLAAAEKP